LWAYVVKNDKNIPPESFITKSSHASFVWDKVNTKFLEKRFKLISKQPLFKGMTFTKEAQKIKSIFPLLIKGRVNDDNIALTNYEFGTDVNFGQLTSVLIKRLQKNANFKIHTNEHISKIKKINNCYHFQTQLGQIHAKFIFLGAGGNSIKILQDLRLPQARGYGGFPISGKWLVCDNKNIIQQHKGKVYSQAETGSPPMSVPHLDIRNINGKQSLLFGPFAGFTFKFLKSGSFLDFPSSIKISNLKEGFLRSERSLIQTAGRAARNLDGRVIFYANQETRSMKSAISEMSRRRERQIAYNTENNITPAGVRKKIKDIIEKEIDTESFKLNQTERKKYRKYEDLTEPKLIKEISKLEKNMQKFSRNLEFEKAAEVRDEIKFLKVKVYGPNLKDHMS
jgi:L-2-hydroxyglutarate oxidase LhgO